MTNRLDTHKTCDGCGTGCACVATVAAQELQPLVAELRGYLEALARSERPADRHLIAAAKAVGDHARARIEALAAHSVVARPAERRRLEVGPVVAAAADALADELADRGIRLQVGPMP